MNSSYQIIPKLLTPTIDPGDQIEIEIFISGYGPIEKNKLVILYSLGKLINWNDAGKLEYSIKHATLKNTGKSQPVSGKDYHETQPIDPVGQTIILNQGYFSDVPDKIVVPFGFPQLTSERTHDKLPPFKVHLNTSEKAKTGDYVIDFIFTYSDNTGIATDHKQITIHVTSWIEKHGKTLEILGILLAAAGLFSIGLGT